LYRYQAPTGYPDRANQWVNTGALLQRLNFGLALSANKIPGTAVKAVAPSNNPAGPGLMDQAIAQLLDGDVTEQTRTILEKQFGDQAPIGTHLVKNGGQMAATDEKPMSRAEPEGDMMNGPALARGQGADRVPRNIELDWPIPAVARPTTPPDPMIAKAFGLVLGSPEFQRR
ncbi:MAG TPA: DUF1800 family protein, partial [Blastocatellia bacterium]